MCGFLICLSVYVFAIPLPLYNSQHELRTILSPSAPSLVHITNPPPHTGHVDPMNAGRYRIHQVYVGNFVPPKAEDVPALMTDLVAWLNSAEAWSLHPVEYAAIAHYR